MNNTNEVMDMDETRLAILDDNNPIRVQLDNTMKELTDHCQDNDCKDMIQHLLLTYLAYESMAQERRGKLIRYLWATALFSVYNRGESFLINIKEVNGYRLLPEGLYPEKIELLDKQSCLFRIKLEGVDTPIEATAGEFMRALEQIEHKHTYNALEFLEQASDNSCGIGESLDDSVGII